jgi:aryl-alcohol dehydrogenase-like predicted oxidoreductase
MVGVGSMGIETRKLGRTGADVTILGYGAMELRGAPTGPPIDEHEAGEVLNAVVDGGINLIDTSIDYGQSEEVIGKYLAHRRDEFFLASKCGCALVASGERPGLTPHDYRPENIRAGLEQSLRRLRTDHLDLLQVHMSPSRDQLESDGTVEEMLALRDEGKIRFLGISGILPNLPDHIDMGVFDVFQIPYSGLQRDHEELITDAAKSGAGTLIRGGAARGGPSDDKAWTTGPLGLDDAARVGHSRWESASLDELLDGMDRMEFTLRFTLSHPDLSSTIVGTKTVSHVRSNIAIAERGPLPADVYAEAKARLEIP